MKQIALPLLCILLLLCSCQPVSSGPGTALQPVQEERGENRNTRALSQDTTRETEVEDAAILVAEPYVQTFRWGEGNPPVIQFEGGTFQFDDWAGTYTCTNAEKTRQWELAKEIGFLQYGDEDLHGFLGIPSGSQVFYFHGDDNFLYFAVNTYGDAGYQGAELMKMEFDIFSWPRTTHLELETLVDCAVEDSVLYTLSTNQEGERYTVQQFDLNKVGLRFPLDQFHTALLQEQGIEEIIGLQVERGEVALLYMDRSSYERTMPVVWQSFMDLLPQGVQRVGGVLRPEDEIWGGAFLEAGRLHVWGRGGSSVYDLDSQEVVYQSPLRLQPLVNGRFYTVDRLEDQNNPDFPHLTTLYTYTLLDETFQEVWSYETFFREPPAWDGSGTILETGAPFRVASRQTGEERRVADLGDYGGGVWISDFNGEVMGFSTTCNPMPGEDGCGGVNLFTGEQVFATYGFFSGIPVAISGNRVFFWQDGSAYGTNGDLCLLLDLNDGSCREIDVGTTICRISDNGNYLLAYYQEQTRPYYPDLLLVLYDAETLEELYRLDLGIEFRGSGYAMDDFSVSNDGRWISFTGRDVRSSQSEDVYLYRIP